MWGEYDGDTVATGRFVGTRDDDVLRVSFVHRTVAGGPVVAGSAVSRIEGEPGFLRLVERFEKDGTTHISVCREVADGARAARPDA